MASKQGGTMAFLVRPKLQVFFKHGGQGWSESWYLPENTVDHKGLLEVGQLYCVVRKQLLGYGAAIIYLRASDDTVKRDSMVKVVSDKDGISAAPNSADTRA